MARLIGFIGKGGTGKSTLAALFLKYILQEDIKPVLVVDADPNSCLAELLSLEVASTVGQLKQELLDKNNRAAAKAISKYDYCEYALNNSVIESLGYDLVVMGRPQGEGCYCYVNNVIKTMIDKLKKSYALIIVDCEAGLEHLSRKTLGQVDGAFIISDLSRKGILTGLRQADLMRELDIDTDKKFLVINNVIDPAKLEDFNDVFASVNNSRLRYAGFIRKDAKISEFELNAKSLLDLPGDSAAYSDLVRIMEEINLANLI
ncbi:MAG: AAA family ATPase [Candidatus Omnitrophota bacterium]